MNQLHEPSAPWEESRALRALAGPMALKIGAELAKDQANGGVVKRRGRVNRTHYYRLVSADYGRAKHLGIASDEFERHDRQLAASGVEWRAHADIVERAKAFLYAALANGTIEWTSSGVSRTWLALQLGITTPVYVRRPKLKEAIDAFDEAHRTSIPASPTYPTLLVDLERLIGERKAAGTLPVFKDVLNKADIARLLAVPETVFNLVPGCVALLEETNEWVRRHDPLRPWHAVNGRNYSFHALVEDYGREFAGKLADRFMKSVDSVAKSTAKGGYGALIRVLQQIAPLLTAETKHELAAKGRAEGPELLAVLQRWRQTVVETARADGMGQSQGTTPASANNVIVGTRRILDKLGIFGDATDALNGIPNATGQRPKASLAEATVACADGLASVVSSYAKSLNLDYDDGEVRSFLSNLALSSALKDVTTANLPEAIRKLNRERIDAIAARAHAAFQAGLERHQRGLALLERGRERGRELDEVMDGFADGRRPWSDMVRLFGDNGDEGLALYLFHVERDHGGNRLRGARAGSTASMVSQGKLVRAMGGAEAVEGMLHLCETAVAAASIVYACESGANSSVARTLLVDCVSNSTVPGHRRVEGWKGRGAKPIVSELPVGYRSGTPSAIAVIEAMIEAQPRLARLADPADRQHLFLTEIHGRMKPLEEHRMLHHLREIVAGDPAFEGLSPRVDMIRSSVLLDAALSNDGNIRVASAIGNHATAENTASYALKMPTRILLERKIREFQDRFEAVAVVGAGEAIELLAMDRAGIERILELAMPTGLGRLCLAPTAGLQPGVPEGDVCAKVEKCAGCKAAVLIADADAVADLVIWHGSLKEVARTWPPERLPRFEAAWLDDLAFCEAAIETMGRGQHARVLRDARRIAERRLAEPGYERPMPW